MPARALAGVGFSNSIGVCMSKSSNGPIKLSESDPVFEVVFTKDVTKKYDPWEVAEKLEDLTNAEMRAYKEKDAPMPSSAMYDIVRKVFGFPTQAEVDAVEGTPEPAPYTLSRHKCVEVQGDLYEFLGNLEAAKKIRAKPQN